jgi:hypothetical protein
MIDRFFYIIKNTVCKIKPTPLPTHLSPEKQDKTKLNKLLDDVHNFKTLTREQVEQVNQLSEDDKLRVIMQYNIAMDTIQIMFKPTNN